MLVGISALGNAAVQRCLTKLMAALGRARQWFRRHVIQFCAASDGRQEPTPDNAAVCFDGSHAQKTNFATFLGRSLASKQMKRQTLPS